MAVWGVVSGATAAVQNYKGLLAVRFVLGFCEAPFFPGAVFLCSSWYKPNELSLRVALLFGGSMLSGSFGGLMAIGITEKMADVAGISSWRWLVYALAVDDRFHERPDMCLGCSSSRAH